MHQVVTKLSKLYPKDTEAPAGGVDDMTKLSYLHEPGVLENLKTRYELNEIYVRFLGSSFDSNFYLLYCGLVMGIYICFLYATDLHWKYSDSYKSFSKATSSIQSAYDATV